MQPCFYIMASNRDGTLYIGVTSDLLTRAWQHKNDLVKGFTQKHQVHCLVWYEPHDNMESAIAREKSLKKWNKIWKLRLIEQMNPDWQDFYEQLI